MIYLADFALIIYGLGVGRQEVHLYFWWHFLFIYCYLLQSSFCLFRHFVRKLGNVSGKHHPKTCVNNVDTVCDYLELFIARS